MKELKAYLCIQAREIENKTFSCYTQTLAIKNAPEATMAEVYLKSEADKVIADLEERHKKEVGQLLMKIAELEKLVETADKLVKQKGFTVKDVTFNGVKLEGFKKEGV